jgi:signal transduction histidine kinase
MIKEEFEKFIKEWSPKIALNCGDSAAELFLRRVDVLKAVVEAETEKLAKNNTALRDETEVLRSLIGADMVSVEGKLLSLVAENSALRDKVGELKSEIEKKSRENFEARTEIETIKRDTAVLEDVHKKELARLNDVIESVRKSLQELNEEWTGKYTAVSSELKDQKKIYQSRLDDASSEIWGFSYLVMEGFISHIRGLLGSIFGATDYLAATVAASPLTHPFSVLKLKKQIAPDVKLIKEHTALLVDALNKISEFFRVAPQRTPSDINAVFRKLKEKYSRLFVGLNVSWPDEKEYPKVMLDETLFGEALSEIIDNSLAALGGEEARSGSIKITLDSDEMFFTIEISDSGPGIPEENIEKLFTPFFTTKPLPHLGLGLVKAKRNILFHSGEIRYIPQSESAAKDGALKSGIFRIRITHQ